MRVLHVSPYFAPAFELGGPPRSILSLCRAQQAAGLDVQVFTTTANGAILLPSAPAGTVYDGVPVRYFPLQGPRLFLWAPQLAGELRRAAANADIIHSHGLFNAPTWQAHRTAVQRGRPLVVSVRGMLETQAREHHRLRKRAAWALFDRRVCDAAALLHTTSQWETTTVTATAPRARVAEIPNAVDVCPRHVGEVDRAAVRARLNIPEGARYVLFLGRLHPIKRLDLLAAAFAKIAGAYTDAQLVIAGDGDTRVRARAEMHLDGLSSRVTWTGSVDGDLRDALLAEATTLVLCSDSENFGMSVAEALTFGVVPVVTQTCPWDMLERERAGFWVPQTVDAIARAITQVLSNPAEARAMGERGRRLVAERFSPAVVGAAWADAYTQLIAR